MAEVDHSATPDQVRAAQKRADAYAAAQLARGKGVASEPEELRTVKGRKAKDSETA